MGLRNKAILASIFESLGSIGTGKSKGSKNYDEYYKQKAFTEVINQFDKYQEAMGKPTPDDARKKREEEAKIKERIENQKQLNSFGKSANDIIADILGGKTETSAPPEGMVMNQGNLAAWNETVNKANQLREFRQREKLGIKNLQAEQELGRKLALERGKSIIESEIPAPPPTTKELIDNMLNLNKLRKDVFPAKKEPLAPPTTKEPTTQDLFSNFGKLTTAYDKLKPEPKKPFQPPKTVSIKKGKEIITKVFDPKTGKSKTYTAPRWNQEKKSKAESPYKIENGKLVKKNKQGSKKSAKEPSQYKAGLMLVKLMIQKNKLQRQGRVNPELLKDASPSETNRILKAAGTPIPPDVLNPIILEIDKQIKYLRQFSKINEFSGTNFHPPMLLPQKASPLTTKNFKKSDVSSILKIVNDFTERNGKKPTEAELAQELEQRGYK